MKCFLCEKALEDREMLLFKTKFFAVRWDAFPVSKGHLLIFPLRHIEHPKDLTGEEWAELKEVMRRAEKEVIQRYSPDGLNWGMNQGKAAGQTIPHLHIHLIPRYKGDVVDPTGGIRTILPGGNYKERCV